MKKNMQLTNPSQSPFIPVYFSYSILFKTCTFPSQTRSFHLRTCWNWMYFSCVAFSGWCHPWKIWTNPCSTSRVTKLCTQSENKKLKTSIFLPSWTFSLHTSVFPLSSSPAFFFSFLCENWANHLSVGWCYWQIASVFIPVHTYSFRLHAFAYINIFVLPKQVLWHWIIPSTLQSCDVLKFQKTAWVVESHLREKGHITVHTLVCLHIVSGLHCICVERKSIHLCSWIMIHICFSKTLFLLAKYWHVQNEFMVPKTNVFCNVLGQKSVM